MNQSVFQSKRFWSAVLGLVVVLLSSIAPELGLQLEGMQEAVVTLIVTLIGAFAIEDVALAINRDKKNEPKN